MRTRNSAVLINVLGMGHTLAGWAKYRGAHREVNTMGNFKLELTLTPVGEPEELDRDVSLALLHRLHSIEPVLILLPWSSSLGRKPYARTPTTSDHSLVAKSDHRATLCLSNGPTLLPCTSICATLPSRREGI